MVLSQGWAFSPRHRRRSGTGETSVGQSDIADILCVRTIWSASWLSGNVHPAVLPTANGGTDIKVFNSGFAIIAGSDIATLNR